MKLAHSTRRFQMRDLPIVILLLICTNKWVFEGILDMTIVEAFFLAVGLAIAIVRKKASIPKASLIWLLYCGSIILSVSMHEQSASVWGRASLMIVIVFYAVFYSPWDFSFRNALRLLTYIAIFHAALVFVHLLLGERFNSLYFPMLPEEVQIVSRSYFRQGYYFGLLYSPHEVAGILSFAIVAQVLQMVVARRWRVKPVMLCLFLAVPLFLTGKKGVLACAMIAALLAVFILYGSKKQWKRLFGVLIVVIVALVAGVAYILNHPENPMFYRFAQFFMGLGAGEVSDSGRGQLYAYALAQWETNRMFGIGWGQFSPRTVSLFGYTTGHQVNLDYLQWLCEMGVVGFVVNMIPVIITVYQTVFVSRRVLKKMRRNGEKWILLFAVFVQIFTLIYAFVEVPFYDIYFFAMYMLSCMVINGVYIRRRGYARGALKRAPEPSLSAAV